VRGARKKTEDLGLSKLELEATDLSIPEESEEDVWLVGRHP